jgi:hypothetical protein
VAELRFFGGLDVKDREYVRRLANTSLRAYAYNLLHFVGLDGVVDSLLAAQHVLEMFRRVILSELLSS